MLLINVVVNPLLLMRMFTVPPPTWNSVMVPRIYQVFRSHFAVTFMVSQDTAKLTTGSSMSKISCSFIMQSAFLRG